MVAGNLARASNLRSATTVSYTHLDVYKRQPAAFENVRYAFFRGLSGEMVELFEMDPDREAGMFAVPQPGPVIK